MGEKKKKVWVRMQLNSSLSRLFFVRHAHASVGFSREIFGMFIHNFWGFTALERNYIALHYPKSLIKIQISFSDEYWNGAGVN